MHLKQAGSATLNAVAPYNFELTVHKPAGWWWSIPDEKYEKGTLWTATRFNGALIGLKLRAAGTPRNPAVDCTFFSSRKLVDEEKGGLMRMLRRALLTDQNLGEFYALAEKDDILARQLGTFAVCTRLHGPNCSPHLFSPLLSRWRP
jgi:hypothetical protein